MAWPGVGDDLQRAEGVAVGEHDVGVLPACRGDRHAAGAVAHGGRRAGVVAVVVRQRDPARPAAPAHLLEHVGDVLVERRPGIDDPARVAADDPRVRPGQRERAGVVGVDERDVEALEGHGTQP